METIRIERNLDPEIKRIGSEIAYIMGNQKSPPGAYWRTRRGDGY